MSRIKFRKTKDDSVSKEVYRCSSITKCKLPFLQDVRCVNLTGTCSIIPGNPYSVVSGTRTLSTYVEESHLYFKMHVPCSM